MARRFTMGTLVTRCKRRADQENASFVSDSEWKALISEQYGELAQIINDAGARYFESESTITANGATSYTEPDDILHIVQVDYLTSDNRRRMLDELMVQERQALAGRTGEAFYWEFFDDQIYLYPKPSTGTYKVLYVPQPTNLSEYATDDLVDVVCPAGERFLIWSVAAVALAKAESSNSDAIRQTDRARDDLMMWAANRALTNPRHRTTRDLDSIPRDPADWYYR